MKITVNGKISEDALKVILETQKKKTIIIDGYCKKEKLESLFYKDSELEYEYQKQVIPKSKKVETRKDAKGN
jgi:Cft2 family RNA processing exonuclease